MARYVIRRLLITIPVIVGVAFLIFTLMYFTPGDPARMILGTNATEEELASMREYLGINEPYIVQLGQFFNKLFIKFDLGESWVYKTNITYEIKNRMPRTFALCVYSVLASAFLGIPLGVLAAVKQNKLADKIVLFTSSIMMCVPNFWIALMLVVLFSLKLGWLPAYGIGGIKYYIIPCFAILITSFAGIARQMRSSMLEIIRSDFVMSAKAQGYPRRNVYYRHALPNALIPIITIMGQHFARGLGGTIILETIFSIPGVGLYIQGGINKRDIPVVTGSVVFLAILFSLIMLVIDIVYASVDPRIKAQFVAQAKKRRRVKT